MSDVFISYSRTDIAFARLLHNALQEHEFETWIDWQDIPPSADWLAEVYEAIEGADTFMFVISDTSVSSEICSLEVAHAVQNHKTSPMVVALPAFVSLVVQVVRTRNEPMTGATCWVNSISIQESLLVALDEAITDSIESIID